VWPCAITREIIKKLVEESSRFHPCMVRRRHLGMKHRVYPHGDHPVYRQPQHHIYLLSCLTLGHTTRALWWTFLRDWCSVWLWRLSDREVYSTRSKVLNRYFADPAPPPPTPQLWRVTIMPLPRRFGQEITGNT
jgi:hypothetical protein